MYCGFAASIEDPCKYHSTDVGNILCYIVSFRTKELVTHSPFIFCCLIVSLVYISLFRSNLFFSGLYFPLGRWGWISFNVCKAEYIQNC